MRSSKVFWTEQATWDLKEIFEYIAKEDHITAKKIFSKIRASCSSLSHNSERCNVISDLKTVGIRSYRQILVVPYRIIFKLDSDRIFIVAVLDGRRDLETSLLQRLLRTNGES